MTEREIIQLGEYNARLALVKNRPDVDIWKLLYPRIYEYSPAGYCSPKFPAASLVSSLTEAASLVPFSKPVAQKLAHLSMPTMWISHNLIDAMRRTTPPAEYDLLDLPLPMPAMTFLLPAGTIKSEKDGDVRFISYARYDPNQMDNGASHLFILSVTETGIMQAMSLGAETSKVDLRNLEAFTDALKTANGKNDTESTMDITLDQQVAFYFPSIILIMISRPDLETKPALIRRVQRRGGSPREFWSPHILGQHYTARREENFGDHQSPRLHWVRGFYRNQPFGPRSKPQHKILWIEPFLRGV